MGKDAMEGERATTCGGSSSEDCFMDCMDFAFQCPPCLHLSPGRLSDATRVRM